VLERSDSESKTIIPTNTITNPQISPFPRTLRFAQPLYVPSPSKASLITSLTTDCSTVDCVWLATDGDREGEAISWHLNRTLVTIGTDTRRVVFPSITKKTVVNALEKHRLIDLRLVSAQESRRVLDRLAGYTVSPVLWKKIAPGLSAGRVQSVGMGMIVGREKERMKFVTRGWHDLEVKLEFNGVEFGGDGERYGGERIRKGAGFDREGKEVGEGVTMTWEDVDEVITDFTGEGTGHLRDYEGVACEVIDVVGRTGKVRGRGDEHVTTT